MARNSNAKRTRWIEFSLDVKAIVREYADRFINGQSDHETLVDYCKQAQADVQLPGFADWVRRDIQHRAKEVTV